ncbi:MAG: methyl-accepting chemotaxis protein [Clostridia bacterium]|jgi:methyl-accepting chemotaxis protein|nr:methyl-accepting chemotaxis protein [Clostridia bacterium]
MKFKMSTKKIQKVKSEQIRGIVSIKYKLILGFVIFAVIPMIVVSMVFYTMARSTLADTSLNFTSEIINQVSINIEYYLESVEKKTVSICIDSIINEGLGDYESTDVWKQVTALRNMESRLVSLTAVDNEIEEIQVIHKNGKIIGGDKSFSEEDAKITQTIDQETRGVWTKGLGSDLENIYYIRNIKALSTGKDIGTLKVKIKIAALIENIKDMTILEGAKLYLSDEKGQIIYHVDETKKTTDETIWSMTTEDEGSYTAEGMLVNYMTLGNGWKIITEIPQNSLTSRLDATNRMVFLLMIVATFLAVLFGIGFSQGFSKPIIRMMQFMKAAEKGDMTVKMDENRKDEIGMLCKSFNQMIANMRTLLQETRGVITQTVEDGKRLKQATEHSVEAFKQLALSIGDIAVGATHQAQDAEKGTEAMYRLSGSIQEVMLDTKEIVGKNDKAKGIIKESSENIQQLNITMKSSMQVSRAIKSSITELSLLTKDIEEVMKLLDGISEQTNLLALNASIEAARAGEVGRGFAVVASEIRNLAEQSKLSTKNVRKTLDTIQDKTKEAVKLVKESNHIVIDQEQSVNNTYHTFNNIVDLLKNMDVSLAKVSQKVNDMEAIKEKAVHKIEKIGAITSDTVAATQEVNALSEEQSAITEQLFNVSNKLTETMDQLDYSMSHFKVL